MNYDIKNFEKILNSKIKPSMFKVLFKNAKNEPHLNKITDEEWDYFINLNLETSGLFTKAIQDLYGQLSTDKYFPKDENFLQINEELKEKGYVVFENFFDEKVVKKINDEIKLSSHKSKTSPDIKIKNDLIDKSKSDKFYSGVFYSYLTDIELDKKSEILKNLVLNKKIKSIVGNYFGSTPFLVGITSFITNPKPLNDFNDKDIHFSAQMFHCDYSHLKFLKVFLFLSDVEIEDQGAHVFVEGSHKPLRPYPQERNYFHNAGLRKKSNNKFWGNIKKEWIDKNFKKEDVKKFCYPKGSVLIEDTSGYHRGSPCLDGQRKVLQLYFAISSLSGGWKAENQPTISLDTNERYLLPLIKSEKEKYKKIELINKFQSKFTFNKLLKRINKILRR